MNRDVQTKRDSGGRTAPQRRSGWVGRFGLSTGVGGGGVMEARVGGLIILTTFGTPNGSSQQR